jgi:hypothetical protein
MGVLRGEWVEKGCEQECKATSDRVGPDSWLENAAMHVYATT